MPIADDAIQGISLNEYTCIFITIHFDYTFAQLSKIMMIPSISWWIYAPLGRDG